jgi:hypothetical protein
VHLVAHRVDLDGTRSPGGEVVVVTLGQITQAALGCPGGIQEAGTSKRLVGLPMRRTGSATWGRAGSGREDGAYLRRDLVDLAVGER